MAVLNAYKCISGVLGQATCTALNLLKIAYYLYVFPFTLLVLYISFNDQNRRCRF